MAQRKPYRGLAMEGAIARWYTRNTGKVKDRFLQTADGVAALVPPGARVLELAPGPGFLAIELARRGYQVTGVDVSQTFVAIATEGAAQAGVRAEFLQGDAAKLPLPDASFDFVVCTAAFKNFTDPLGALDEVHRVLKPGGAASIQDLRKDASWPEIREEVARMKLTPFNALFTRLTFRFLLLENAYTREAIGRLARQSRFGGGQLVEQGVGFDLRLARAS